MSTTQPEALRLAGFLDKLDVRTVDRIQNCVSAAAELRRLHARIAELEAQLSAVPLMGAAGDAGWVMVPVDPTPEMWKAARAVPDPNPPYPPHYALVWDAMLAAAPPAPSSAKGVAHG